TRRRRARCAWAASLCGVADPECLARRGLPLRERQLLADFADLLEQRVCLRLIRRPFLRKCPRSDLLEHRAHLLLERRIEREVARAARDTAVLALARAGVPLPQPHPPAQHLEPQGGI